MNPRTTVLAIIALGMVALGVSDVTGQQIPLAPRAAGSSQTEISPAAMQELYQRLLQAEQRIQELESRPPAAGTRTPAMATGTVLNRGWEDEAEAKTAAAAKTAAEAKAKENEELAKRLKKLEESAEKQKKDDEKKKADAAKKPTQKWTGRVHADYWGFPNESPLANQLETGDPSVDPLDRFNFRRLRFGVAGDILDTMNYKIEMEFADPSNIAFKDAYLGWQELPFLQTVLLGNQKRPYGLDHLNSSRYNVFMERPYVVEAFNQDARRMGLQSYGVSEDERFNWRFGTFFLEDVSKIGGYEGDQYQMEVAGRFANTIWYDETSDGRGYAHWAVSGSYADPSANAASPQSRFRTRPEARSSNRWLDTGVIPGAESYELVGLEGVVNVGSLQVVGEWMNTWVHRSTGSGPDVRFDGGYVYMAYFLTGEHTPWELDSGTIGRVKPFENFFLVDRLNGCRGRGLGAWQVAARYSHGDFSDNDIFGGVGDSVTLGMNWWWTAYSRWQFNYIHGSIAQRDGILPGTDSGDYDIFGMRFMVDF
jgi:phosphate-selective porin OprO/OprP